MTKITQRREAALATLTMIAALAGCGSLVEFAAERPDAGADAGDAAVGPTVGDASSDGASDASTDGSSAADATTDGGAKGPCRVDGLTVRNNQYLIAAKGRLVTADGTWKVLSSVVLDTLAGFRDGPCAGQAAGACALDALSWTPSNNSLTVVRGPRFWNLNATYTGSTNTPTAGAFITDVPILASDACAGLTQATCSLEAWSHRPDTVNWFAVRAGKIFAYSNETTSIGPAGGTAMTGVPGLAAMCAAAGPGCPVDDVDWRDDVKQFHYFAAGRFWATDVNVNAVAGSGTPIAQLGDGSLGAAVCP